MLAAAAAAAALVFPLPAHHRMCACEPARRVRTGPPTMAGVDEEAPMSKAEIDAWLAAQTGAIDGRAQELLDGAGVTAPPPLPVAGEMEWGRWSQRGAALSFELRVPEATRAADVRCECLVGFLDVRVRDEPLLSGRLAAAEARQDAAEWLRADQNSTFGP